jgi:hypothetical protein
LAVARVIHFRTFFLSHISHSKWNRAHLKSSNINKKYNWEEMNQRQERLPLVSPSPLGQDESTGSQVQRRLCASALSPRSLYGWEWLRLTLVSVLLREAGDEPLGQSFRVQRPH